MPDLTGWTLVYDLDGTLVDSAPDLHAALNYTLRGLELDDVPLSAIRPIIGDGAKAMIRKGLRFHGRKIDEVELDKALWPVFIDFYSQNASQRSAPFKGVTEQLIACTQAGAIQSVCTNKAEMLAKRVLEGLGLAEFFQTLTAGDTFDYRKPDGRHILSTLKRTNSKPKRSIMIGDSPTDQEAAYQAGLDYIYFSQGYGTLAEGFGTRPKIMTCWDQFPDLLRRIVSV